MSKSNMRNKQLMVELNNSQVMLSAGAMQYMIGSIEMTSGVKGVGGLMRNLVSSAITGTSAIKPLYKGTGTIMLETTYKYLWLIDVDNDHIVVDDGMSLLRRQRWKSQSLCVRTSLLPYSVERAFLI